MILILILIWYFEIIWQYTFYILFLFGSAHFGKTYNNFIFSFQRLPSGAWPTNSQVKRIRICFVYKKGGGRKCDCPNEWTMARLKIDPNQLGNTKATNQSKWWYVSFCFNCFFLHFAQKYMLKDNAAKLP